jgi:hypothetical protein
MLDFLNYRLAIGFRETLSLFVERGQPFFPPRAGRFKGLASANLVDGHVQITDWRRGWRLGCRAHIEVKQSRGCGRELVELERSPIILSSA